MKIGAGVATGLLVAAISCSAPSAAFALELGPFHIGLPFLGHHFAHRHRSGPRPDVPAEARLCDYAGPQSPAAKRWRKMPSVPLRRCSIPVSPCRSSMMPFFGPRLRCSGLSAMTPFFMPRSAKRPGTRGGANVRPIVDPRSSSGRPAERSGRAPPSGRCCRNFGGALAMTSGFVAKFCPERDARPAGGAPEGHGNAARSIDHGARYDPRAAAGFRTILESRLSERAWRRCTLRRVPIARTPRKISPRPAAQRRRRSIGRSMRSINR